MKKWAVIAGAVALSFQIACGSRETSERPAGSAGANQGTPAGSEAAKPSGTEMVKADIINQKGQTIGNATFTNTPAGVQVGVDVSDLPPGEHGIHIHEVGKCDPPDFKTAGAHFTLGGAHHGMKNPKGPHAGDLPNLVVGPDGKGSVQFTNKLISLGTGDNSLFHTGGTAIVIHAKPDDMMTDPSGNSGDRIACGVIVKIQ